MKNYNPEKLKTLKKIEPIFRLFSFFRILLIPFAFLIRLLNRNRVDCLVADGFLIGDTVLLRPLIFGVQKAGKSCAVICGKHGECVLEDIPITKMLYFQWPWANYNYSLSGLLKLVSLWFKIFLMQPKIIIEPRGDFRSMFVLYFAFAEKLAGFSFTGGKWMLDFEPLLTDGVFHLEEHNRKLAEILKIPYNKNDLFRKKNAKLSKRIGLSFSGSQKLKTLPLEIFLNTIDPLKKSGLELVYIKSPVDRFFNEHKSILLENYITLWEGSFTEYFHLMEGLTGYIGMDSGGGHIASMFQIPSMIYFGTQFSSYCKPLNPNLFAVETMQELKCRPCAGNLCIHSTHQYCLNSISLVELDLAVRKFISLCEVSHSRYS